ncbi:MAG TPA: nucleoside triphosphate pyrophosphohydrolase [Gemmatimonadaceae bacterium]|jgi:MazG family protein|nr:nucleoside triphosphate pyrophosphohydrolase [Gemmatimonadaceae bacterium]
MQDDHTLEDALELMRDLRARCEWDRAQTHESLRPYLIEEAHELDDALRAADTRQMREELGDVLLQVLFHSVIAEEKGEFDAGDVAAALIEKMKRRHPHLYGGGERQSWEAMKARNRASIAEGLPAGLPALHRAHRLQDRAAGVGFDWSDTEGPARKVEEELGEVRELLPAAGRDPGSPEDAHAHEALAGELGDLLFAVVNLCRRAGVHASLALDRANDKFVRRFERVEQLAAQRGIVMGEADLATLDALWDEVKSLER